jgi:hypothetical protein
MTLLNRIGWIHVRWNDLWILSQVRSRVVAVKHLFHMHDARSLGMPEYRVLQ